MPAGALAARQQSQADKARDQDLARRRRDPFDADARRQQREDTPVVVGGISFKRRRKVWDVTRLMREIARDQETAIARSTRLIARTAELESEQIEAAAKGETDREEELETTIAELLKKSDEGRSRGELMTFRLIALLLVPPDAPAGDDAVDELLELRGAFGPVEDEAAAMPAVEFLAGELDEEDAIDLARELTGQIEPDPQMTPSSETGST